MRCDTRTEPFNFWNFRCRKRSKKAFCSFDFWELSKFYFNVFPETNVVYLLAVKDSLLGKSLRENYFSDAKCLGPLLQRSPLNTINNVGKIFCHINYGVVQGFPSLRTEAITTHVKRYDIFFTCVWYRQSTADTSFAFRATRSGWWMSGKAFTILNSWPFVGIFSDYVWLLKHWKIRSAYRQWRSNFPRRDRKPNYEKKNRKLSINWLF